MRNRYRQTRNELKAHLCERVAATGSLAAACREAGMPHVETVRLWAKADVSFAEMLALARRKGWFARKWAFDAAKARRVLEHLRTPGGGGLRTLPSGPEWPTLRMVRYWRAVDGEFAAEVWRLIGDARTERHRAMAGRRKARPFDWAVADRVILAVGRGTRVDLVAKADPTLPSRGIVSRWRRENAEFAAGLDFAMNVRRARLRRQPAMLSDGLRREIIDRIREGGSLASLGRDADMPAAMTLYGWIRRSPEFAREVMRACDDREDWWTDQISMAMEAPFGSAAEMRRALAPLNKQWQRHQKRPGRKWR